MILEGKKYIRYKRYCENAIFVEEIKVKEIWKGPFLRTEQVQIDFFY